MPATEFTLNHPLAVQRWSTSLAVEAAVKSYWSRFITQGNESPVKLKTELHKGAGEKITMGLRAKLSEDGVEGDNIIEGHATGEEALQFFNDSMFIDQLRKSTKSKGRMSEQRVPYNMRREGRDALSTWWSEYMDEQFFMYAAGARGIDTSYKVPLTWTGRANNPLTPIDAGHMLYGGDATSSADLDSADAMTLETIEKAVAKAETMDPMLQGININGSRKFVLVMHTFQAFQLRTSITENDWLQIHKATDRGSKALMYKNALGEYADVVLHKHRNVVRFDDYGAGSDVTAARALFLGAQALLIAYGQDNSKNRYTWNEEADDRGNALAITAGSIFGVKRSEFNNATFGLFGIDSYVIPGV
jgi:N4-gp56 family major capsid protein